MAEFTIQAGTNTGTAGDDIFKLDNGVGDFQIDGLDGFDQAWLNLTAVNGASSFQNLEGLVLYGARNEPFVFSSGIPVVDISRVETLVMMTTLAPEMTVIGGPTSYVGVASDLPLGYAFESGEAALAVSEEDYVPFLFQDIKGVIGGAGNDVFIGDERDNDFLPGLGQNAVVGGAGLDRVIIFVEQYDTDTTEVFRDGDAVVVAAQDGSGVRALETERIILSNAELDLLGYVAFDTDAGQTAGTTYRTYQAAFNRTPDNDGLKFWIEQVDRGMSFVEMCSYFVASEEFKERYGPNPSNHDYVEALYGNVLQREPDQGGIDFWQGVLDRGELDRANILLQFSDHPENLALVAPAIEDGILII